MIEKEKTLEDLIGEIIASYPGIRNGFSCHFLASQRESFLKKIMGELRKLKIKAPRKKTEEIFDRLAKEKGIKFN